MCSERDKMKKVVEKKALEEKNRNLVIEILRIVAMIMIVCGHAILYGVGNYSDKMGCFWLKVIEYICKSGTDIFVIISGYFMLNSKFSIKKLLLTWLEVFFYSILLYLVMVILGDNNLSTISFLKALFPISFNQYWFICVYLYMYLCSPFLNLLLMRLHQKAYCMLLGLGWILMVIPASIPVISTFNTEAGNGILWFFMLYCTGGYFCKYPPKHKARTSFFVAGGLLCLSIILEVLVLHVSTWIGFDGKGVGRFSSFDSFPIYGAAVAIFCAFLQLSKKNIKSTRIKKFILFLSRSSFSVYLIHEHPNVRLVLWNTIQLSQYDGFALGGMLTLSIVGIYLGCVIIDKLTWNIIKNIFVKMRFDNIDCKIQKILVENDVIDASR